MMPTLDDLFEFQREAVDKLVPEPAVIIADDMGLGKTVEAVALDVIRRKKYLHMVNNRALPKKTLVLCPLSVISNWEDHFAEWAPHLKVYSIDRKNRVAFENALVIGRADVFICHWDVVRLIPELAKHTWFHVIADEAHRVGNREAQVTVRSKKIKWRFLSELTGTPCTSKPQQFWSLLNWAKPRRFTSFHRFFNHHVISVQHRAGGDCPANLGGGEICLKDHKVPFNVIIGVAHERELLDEIAPYYVRRLKEDVLEDLPDKYYTTLKVELGAQQRRVYDQMKREMLAWVGEHEDEPLAVSQAVVKLIRLQQLACAYAEITWEKKRKRVFTSEQAATLGKAAGTAGPDQFVYEDVRKVRLTDPSAKLDALMEVLDANPEKQFVVFSQSKQVVKLFEKRLHSKNIPYGILTGDTPQADRGNMVAAFQRGELRVFTGTIQAGGVGITLTAASTVVFLDRSWSPSINKQAEDRLHRIGQKEAVQVIDIVARNTVDLGKLTKLEAGWRFIKMLLGDEVEEPKPEGAYI
jgi:SNF2 family DNA or RNA helicase